MIQRVRSARVTVADEVVAEIGIGLLVLAAVEKGDGLQAMRDAARKIRELRVFSDDAGKMNRDLADVGGAVLAVSQFTLAGSLERGRRPSFDNAEEPERARQMFEVFVAANTRPLPSACSDFKLIWSSAEPPPDNACSPAPQVVSDAPSWCTANHIA